MVCPLLSCHTYFYATANPLRFTDPLGLKVVPCPPGMVTGGGDCTIDDGKDGDPSTAEPKCASTDCIIHAGTHSGTGDTQIGNSDYDPACVALCLTRHALLGATAKNIAQDAADAAKQSGNALLKTIGSKATTVIAIGSSPAGRGALGAKTYFDCLKECKRQYTCPAK